jgi:hypothetical protein
VARWGAWGDAGRDQQMEPPGPSNVGKMDDTQVRVRNSLIEAINSHSSCRKLPYLPLRAICCGHPLWSSNPVPGGQYRVSGMSQIHSHRLMSMASQRC